MRMQTLLRLFLTISLLVLPETARAQFVVYTDLASFLAATSGAGVDSFDDLFPGDTPNGPLLRNAGTFAYSASVNTSSFFGAGSAGDTWLSANVSTDIITFSGFDATVRGVGGFFFGTDANGAPMASTDLFVTAMNAGGSYSQTLVSPTVGSFFGVVSTGGISSLTVEVQTPTAGFAWPTVNSLTVAGAPTVVPEPSSFVLLAAGAAGVLVIARRRTRG